MYEDEEYFDPDGNPTTLYRLIRAEPDWAASVIRQYKKENERMRKFIDRVQTASMTETILLDKTES
jgi:hypothetical protein